MSELIETLIRSRMGHLLSYEMYVSDGVQLFPLNGIHFDVEKEVLILAPEHVKIDLSTFYDKLGIEN